MGVRQGLQASVKVRKVRAPAALDGQVFAVEVVVRMNGYWAIVSVLANDDHTAIVEALEVEEIILSFLNYLRKNLTL